MVSVGLVIVFLFLNFVSVLLVLECVPVRDVWKVFYSVRSPY
jgi:hypothetical protein